MSCVNVAELMSKSQTSVEVMPTPSPPVINMWDVPKAQHENLERKLGAGDRSAIGVNWPSIAALETDSGAPSGDDTT